MIVEASGSLRDMSGGIHVIFPPSYSRSELCGLEHVTLIAMRRILIPEKVTTIRPITCVDRRVPESFIVIEAFKSYCAKVY